METNTQPLKSLAESRLPSLCPGKVKIWYARPGFTCDSMMGHRWLEKQKILPKKDTLSRTHVKLGEIKEERLDYIYSSLQGENWSPNGEASGFIASLGLSHTSMSVGDVIEINDELFLVDIVGFKRL